MYKGGKRSPKSKEGVDSYSSIPGGEYCASSVMSSRRARGRPAADAEGGQPEQPPPLPPTPPEDPPRVETGGEDGTARTDKEESNSGAGGGAGASLDSGAMRAAVLEALSDPAVVCQLAAAVSTTSMSVTTVSASARDDGEAMKSRTYNGIRLVWS